MREMPDVLRDRYRIETLLDARAGCRLYAAQDTSIQKQVWIEALPGIPSASARQRFVKHHAMLERLLLAHIATALDIFHDDKHNCYIVWQPAPGKSLHELISEHSTAKFALDDTLAMIIPVVEILQRLHQHSIPCGGLAPRQVYISPDNSISLMHFYVEKLYGDIISHRVLAVPVAYKSVCYHAPEEIRGEALTMATDVRAVGVMLYQLLSGVFPFQGTSFMQTLMMIVKEGAVPIKEHCPDLAPALATLIMTMLATEPTQRPTMETVLTVLRHPISW